MQGADLTFSHGLSRPLDAGTRYSTMLDHYVRSDKVYTINNSECRQLKEGVVIALRAQCQSPGKQFKKHLTATL